MLDKINMSTPDVFQYLLYIDDRRGRRVTTPRRIPGGVSLDLLHIGWII